MNPYKYMLATKGMVVICIKYTDHAIVNLFNILHEKGWTMEVSDEYTYETQRDRVGGRIQCRYYDANTKIDL